MRYDGFARAEGTSGRKPSANPSAISLSVDNDIERLSARGFDCSSPEARYIVERVSMHRLEAYLPVVSDNARAASLVDGQIIEHGDPELKEAHDLITYDRRVQVLILKYTGILEGQFRARYARFMTALHGDMALYDPDLFNRRDKYDDTIAVVTRELARQRGRNKFIGRHIDSRGRVPLGIAIEYLTLGTLSKLYDNTRDRHVVDGIASGFNLNSSKARSWFKTIANVRNICAHFNPYVVRKQIPTTPLPMRECEYPSNSPFYIFPMLDRMLSSDDARTFNDRNLNYSERMIADMAAETTEFSRLYMGTVMALNVPKRFLDTSEGTWTGLGDV